ncbi:MAG: nitroreductase family protein [Chloroflexota bacterium]
MNVYEAIAARHTIRDFQDRPIAMPVLQRLLAAGMQAPSNDHLRKWAFIIVQDKTERQALIGHIRAPKTAQEATALVDEWGLSEPSQREMYIDAIPKQHSMLLEAGALILPCFYAGGSLLHPTTLSSLNGFASIWCCIENILIAAASEGIYGVTRIPFEEERTVLKQRLNIPEGYEVPCYLALGYPKQDARKLKQYPVRLEDRIHVNGWSKG